MDAKQRKTIAAVLRQAGRQDLVQEIVAAKPNVKQAMSSLRDAILTWESQYARNEDTQEAANEAMMLIAKEILKGQL